MKVHNYMVMFKRDVHNNSIRSAAATLSRSQIWWLFGMRSPSTMTIFRHRDAPAQAPCMCRRVENPIDGKNSIVLCLIVFSDSVLSHPQTSPFRDRLHALRRPPSANATEPPWHQSVKRPLQCDRHPPARSAKASNPKMSQPSIILAPKSAPALYNANSTLPR